MIVSVVLSPIGRPLERLALQWRLSPGPHYGSPWFAVADEPYRNERAQPSPASASLLRARTRAMRVGTVDSRSSLPAARLDPHDHALWCGNGVRLLRVLLSPRCGRNQVLDKGQ